MNNRRNLKENLTISNKQRFSIRKFSIGVASVMLGTTLYFMGGVGTSIVHADSVQGQSVQTSNLDTNSAQASSDTSSAEQTSSQNQTSSAQNSQKAVSNASSNTESTDSKTQTSDQVDNATTDKNEASQADNATTDKNEASQADNASATNIKTRDNKKVVSDANRAKSTANDAQTKPAQQTAKSDAANSNTLVVQRTKKLTVNAKLLADSKAQTDTKTDSKYSVTDNYPKDLMNYLPSNFENKQEYAFEWLQNENNNNIILTTNRTGDGVVYVYQDGEKVGTLARKSLYPLPLYDNIWEDEFGRVYGDEIGTVYNDDYAGIVQSNGLKIIYSSHAKDVDNAGSSYSTVSFFVPHKITQTVTYKDSDGHVIDRLTHTQDGLTGQSYTTGLPSGPKYVQQHQYLSNITQNGSGLISEFGDGYSCTKDYHDGVSVTFTEHDSEKTGIGTMDYVIYEKSGYDDSKKVVQKGSLAYGQSTNYTNDSGRYTIVNPYVPQTTNIVYQYEPLGNVVNIVPGPEGKTTTTTTQYKNNPNDPTKVKPINVPSIPGYTTLVNGKTISAKTIKIADPGKDTIITYTANDGTQTIVYKEEDGSEVGKQVVPGKTDETVKVTPDVPDGYVVKGEIPTEVTIKPADTPITVTVEHGKSHVTPDKPVNKGDLIPGTKDKHYPEGLTHNDLNKTVTREVTITDPTGKKTTTTQTVTFTRGATVDEVTNKVTYDDWSENGKHTFDKVDVPTVPGYTASGEVPKVVVTPDTQSSTVNITYTANDGTQTIVYKEEDGSEVGKQVVPGKTDETVKVTPDVPDGYVVKGEIPTEVTIKPADTPITVTVEHGKSHVTPDKPVNKGDLIPGTKDKHYPEGLTHNDLNKTVTREVTITDPTGKKTTTTQTVTFTRGATVDEVTNKVTYDDWSENGKHTFDKVDVPTVPGYTASGEVPKVVVTPDTQSSTVNITYTANDGTQTIVYKEEDGSEVGKQVVPGKTDETVKVTPDVPDGYVVKGEIPTEVTIKPADTPITVTVEHGKSHVTPDKPVNKGDLIPGTKDKHYPEGLTHNDLNKTVTREVTITDPTGKKTTTTQTVTFTRGATVDEVTNKVTYDDWSENGKHTFDKVDVPTVPGYTASGEVPKVVVTPDTQSSTVNITYTANDGTQTIVYKEEDGSEVGKQVVPGKTDETVKVTPDVPDGYVVKGEIPTEVTIKPADTPITVTVEHGKSHVTPDKPVNKGDLIPGTKDKHYPEGLTHNDLNKTVTREVTITDPTGKKTTTTQTVTFTRGATVDEVTNKVTYDDWSENGKHTFDKVDVPTVPGYTASGEVPKVVVTPDTQSSTVNITYTANDGTQTIVYKEEDGSEVGKQVVPGKTDETVKDKDKLNKTNPKKVAAHKKERKIIKTKIAKQGHTEIAEPIEDKVTRENNVKVVSDPVENKAAEPKLPQTGEANNSIIGLLGMLLASFAAMFGFDSLHSHDKKHKN